MLQTLIIVCAAATAHGTIKKGPLQVFLLGGFVSRSHPKLGGASQTLTPP